jgi:hypothetical protein
MGTALALLATRSVGVVLFEIPSHPLFAKGKRLPALYFDYEGTAFVSSKFNFPTAVEQRGSGETVIVIVAVLFS